MYTLFNGVGKPAHKSLLLGETFSPLSIFGNRLWLDAADTTTITHTGGNVSQWDDKSGGDRHFTHSTGSYQPTTGIRTLNGLNVLDFTEDYLQNTANIAEIFTSSGTWFVVSEADDTATGNLMYVCNSGAEDGTGTYNGAGAADILEVALTRESKAGSFFYQDGSSASLPTSLNSFADNTQINFATYTPSTATLVGNSSGETDAGGAIPASSTYTPTRFRVGAHGTPSSRIDRWFNGAIGEVLVYNRVLSNAEINQIGAYLSAKWGVSWVNV